MGSICHGKAVEFLLFQVQDEEFKKSLHFSQTFSGLRDFSSDTSEVKSCRTCVSFCQI